MEKRHTNGVLMGAILIAIGLGMLGLGAMRVLFGFHLWDLWPLTVIGTGLLLVLPPLRHHNKPGLAWLFILGLPTLASGGLLLLGSVFNAWGVWAWLWPMLVLALAAGFLAAALRTGAMGFLIPGIIIGANGLLFQFCSITGWWGVWAWLWIVEPLSVGLALLLASTQRRAPGLTKAGLILCGVAALGLMLSVAVELFFPLWWLWRWLGPLALIAAGIALLAAGALRRPASLER